jgi:predicted amidohydrolase
MRIAIVQMRSTDDPWENLFLTQSFIAEAQTQKCDLICFPENVFYRGPRHPKDFERSEIFLDPNPERALREGNDWNKAFYEAFSNLDLAVSLGSVLEAPAEGELPYNAHWFIKPGEKPISYHKIHLFHFDAPGAVYRESQDYQAGEKPVTVEWRGWKFGLSICYDLRFPELFRNLVVQNKSDVLLIPAAFTALTGELHWELLLRSRAVENLSYVIASAQWGDHFNSRGEALSCYGNALMVHPWGGVLDRAPFEGENMLVCELSREELNEVRKRLPALQNCRLI